MGAQNAKMQEMPAKSRDLSKNNKHNKCRNKGVNKESRLMRLAVTTAGERCCSHRARTVFQMSNPPCPWRAQSKKPGAISARASYTAFSDYTFCHESQFNAIEISGLLHGARRA
jgi:hypothetical protein